MEWLSDFQGSFREPVYGFLASYWPVIAIVLLLALGWLVGSLMPGRGGDGGVSIGNKEPDSDGGGDGGGD